MLVTKDFPNKEFRSKQELHAELRANKKGLYASKMLAKKETDSVIHHKGVDELSVVKEENTIEREVNKLKVKAVINSCGIFDSHRDVHIPGCWDKTAKDSSVFYHLQDHRQSFGGTSVIAFNPVKSVEKIDINGIKTDALVMTSIVEKSINKYMFERYKNNNVKFHSVGMQYVKGKLFLCIDSNHEDDKKEKENYDKYVGYVINKEVMEQYGYFWAVTEAKAYEGSAVLFASNSETPVLSVEEISDEPSNDTQDKNEPSNDTQNEVLKSILNIKIK